MRARRGCCRSKRALERATREGIGEQTASSQSTTSSGSWIVHTQQVELAPVDGRAAVGASLGSSARADATARCAGRRPPRRWCCDGAPPPRAAGRRRCRARRRASSHTGHAQARWGARATIAAAASAARARPSSVVRSAAASTRSSRNCRNGVAVRAHAGAPRDRRATRRRGRGPRGGRPPRTGSRNAAPSRTTARLRPGPAASASYASTTLRARFFRIWKWSSASAVPQVATALGAPASANAMTSV